MCSTLQCDMVVNRVNGVNRCFTLDIGEKVITVNGVNGVEGLFLTRMRACMYKNDKKMPFTPFTPFTISRGVSCL